MVHSGILSLGSLVETSVDFKFRHQFLRAHNWKMMVPGKCYLAGEMKGNAGRIMLSHQSASGKENIQCLRSTGVGGIGRGPSRQVPLFFSSGNVWVPPGTLSQLKASL